jgi:transcription-repair coupling factor (superfamily II helicase)
VREVDLDARGLHLPSRPPRRYAGDLRALAADLQSGPGSTVLFLGTPGRAERLKDVLREDGLSVGEGTPVEVRLGVLGTGFELPDLPLRVLADGDVFPEEVHLHRRRGRGARSFLSDFRDLKVGDLVVHQDHGIGRFEGLETMEVGGSWSQAPLRREFMVLVYQGGDKLKVPVESFDRVQKYASAEGARPIVDKLGSGSWEKIKRRVKKAMRDMAAELLKLYAERKARPGHAFTGESPWQREFEESFEYDETPDQAAAIADVMQDMSDDSPMDRSSAADVGYGKTEVAMRGAMRAVLDAKQVAVLTPTTILAFQHWKTFRKRFAPFPVRVEMVSRFRSPKEIKSVLKDTAEGKVDVLIGTHRLLSKDVAFRDLGLLVIDEEQRFGWRPRKSSSTCARRWTPSPCPPRPIPRTAADGAGRHPRHVGHRDAAQGPPGHPDLDREVLHGRDRHRHPSGAGPRRAGLLRAQPRGSIYALAHMVQKLVPEARVAVAHGQMPEAELEKAMLAFVEGRADVLVATTIIENGLDIPRANTMIINRADRYGLAQLYQLRGRVGRSERRASAFLMVPPGHRAQRDRAQAPGRHARVLRAGRGVPGGGAGPRAARGRQPARRRAERPHRGGGPRPLREAPRADDPRAEGPGPARVPRTVLNLRVDLRIPEEYVPEVHQRMSLYKRVSQVRDAAEVATLAEELRDRYGPFPRGRSSPGLRGPALARGGPGGHPGGPGRGRAAPAPRSRDAARRGHPSRRGAGLAGGHPRPVGVLRAPLSGDRAALEALGEVLQALEGVLEGARRTAV